MEAEKVIISKPQLIFQEIIFRYPKKVSALKLAIELLDTRMVEMFLEKSKSYGAGKFLEMVEENKLFSINNSNLGSLLNSYYHYTDKLELLRKKEIGNVGQSHMGDSPYDLLSEVKAIEKAYLTIIEMQQDPLIFPRHMLKDFIRLGYDNLDKINNNQFISNRASAPFFLTPSQLVTSPLGRNSHQQLTSLFPSVVYNGAQSDLLTLEAIYQARFTELSRLVMLIEDSNKLIRLA